MNDLILDKTFPDNFQETACIIEAYFQDITGICPVVVDTFIFPSVLP